MSVSETDYWVGFSLFSGIGPVRFQQLLDSFTTAKAAWEASEKALLPILKEKKTKDFLSFRETFDFEMYKKRLEKTHVSILTIDDPLYPLSLKEIKNPPFVLYVKGSLELFYSSSERSESRSNSSRQARTITKIIAIVGTRKITQYGRDVTELFTQALVHAGCTIISGLAMGVDTIAHKTTLDSGGKTIAVLGCGVDCCYPQENETLYDEIIEKGGAVISEVPLGMGGTIGTFPARNRIVAGLSDAVLVTEGAVDSGALITAQFGIDYGKKVFAVPGPITSNLSKGPYTLIEKGAKLVTDPKDILKELQIGNDELRIDEKKKIIGETEEEQMIIDLLQNESMSFDEIARSTKIDSSKLASIVSMMEIKGLIKNNGNGGFVITQ